MMARAVVVLGLVCFLCSYVVGAVQYDVAVYGATASGVLAAAAAANEGASVILLEPGKNVGGMVSGGLGHTDQGDATVIGGAALEVFKAIGAHYKNSGPVYDFEPHVAEAAFFAVLAAQNITVQFGQRVASVTKSGTTATSLTTEAGLVVSASIFIDASYEGDLLPLLGVDYAWGREGVADYNETLAGRLKEPSSVGGHQFTVKVDPFWSNGSVLNLVYGGDPGVPGQADKKVQAYNYRMCLTNNAANMIPLPTPANYQPENWELFRRYIIALNTTDLAMSHFMIISSLPNMKTDINNNGAISTDFIGGSWGYPDSNWDVREQIIEAHIQYPPKNYIEKKTFDEVRYTLEFFYFLGNDPIVPESLRATVKTYGLAKDEFINTNNWPHQLYVREARRMVGEYVMTQYDRYETVSKNDSIGLGSYNIDTHNAQRFPQDGYVLNDGDVEQTYKTHFQIPYRSLVPKATQCTNLIVPVCTSSTHIGYGPIRLEPQFMIMGQSAGVAAAQAVSQGVAVQNIDIPTLQKRLVTLNQFLDL